MADDVIKPIQIRFNKTYSRYFDAMFNCQLSNRKSDTGLVEVDRPMLGLRDGTIMVGNSLSPEWNVGTAYGIGDIVSRNGVMYKANAINTGSQPPSANWDIFNGKCGKLFYFTDKLGVRRAYKTFDQKLYYLNGSTWTSLGSIGSDDVEYSIARVPLNNSGLDSLARITPNVSGGAEKVKKDAADPTNPNNNIGTILLITSGLYKGCYAPIISYDSAGQEYTLGGAGIITALPAGTTYKRYDRIADVLQIARGYSDLGELYFDGIIPMSWYSSYTTDSLITVSAISTGKGLKKMVAFNNYCWTFSGTTLYYTGGYPGNPLFFNYTGALTVSSNGSILDIFQYKTRLVIIGTNFIFSMGSDLKIDRHVTSFGGFRDGYVNTGGDAYILTSARTLVSLKETIAGVVEVKDDFGKEIANYTAQMGFDSCFGYDSYRVYMYGSSSPGANGIMCVYDTTYQYWIIYDNLRPSSITSEGLYTYLTDNNSDIVRRFDSSVHTDVQVGGVNTIAPTQSLTLKEIDFNDIFSQKLCTFLQFACENFTQAFLVDLYFALNNDNGKRKQQKITLDEILIGGGSLGQGTLGQNTFGQAGKLDTISVPRLKMISYPPDSSNIFKIRISSTNGLSFYLSQIEVGMGWSGTPKTYFDPANNR